MPYDSRLSRRIDELRSRIDHETRDLRHELFITRMQLHGTPSRIPRALAAVKRDLKSKGPRTQALENE